MTHTLFAFAWHPELGISTLIGMLCMLKLTFHLKARKKEGKPHTLWSLAGFPAIVTIAALCLSCFVVPIFYPTVTASEHEELERDFDELVRISCSMGLALEPDSEEMLRCKIIYEEKAKNSS